jgi:hypothetical protein
MDDGEPTQLSSTTRVVIKVQDINDNAPEFDQKTYNVEIPSNARINQKLFQVSIVLSEDPKHLSNLHREKLFFPPLTLYPQITQSPLTVPRLSSAMRRT